ncbi:hypothetical protein [Ornatilinea apprima]|uniref:hypothetical protein n=1 Tax=Ornatilinea apprima TaxID=1134406 RepID=UPI000A81ED28|nr:hypothetical protein [Ornatilinea apprima]
MKKWLQKLTPGQIVTLFVGFITAFAVIVAAIVQSSKDKEAVQLSINATQTAEAKFTEIALSATLPPTDTPSPTPTPSLTSTSSPTLTPSPTTTELPTLFSDDFEAGGQKWTSNSEGIWMIQGDSGNHFYCVDSKNYAKAYPNNKPTWDNFVLEFDILIRSHLKNSV